MVVELFPSKINYCHHLGASKTIFYYDQDDEKITGSKSCFQ